MYQKLLDYLLNFINSNRINRLLYRISSFINRKSFSNLFFKKIRSQIGDVRYFLTIGTPIQKHIYNFFLTLGYDVFEGYGMAETAYLITIPCNKRENNESVGKFMDGINYKFIDNEIALKGPNIAKEYYNRPDQNKLHYNGN